MDDPLPPIVEIAIEPRTKADLEKLGVALAKLTTEDPSFRASTDLESGQISLKGVSEAHLSGKIDILKRDYEVEADIGAPQVIYLESLTKRAEVDYTHKRRIGGARQYARVKIVFEPRTCHGFESRIAEGAVPKEFVLAVEKGVQSVTSSGSLAGFPVVNMKATLVDVDFHEVDSSAPAFEIASRAATREALQKGGSVLLEPIMNVAVTAPEECAGGVIRDLHSRRAENLSRDARGDTEFIEALVPLANMFGYFNTLRALSLGRASCSERFSHYAPVQPPEDGPFHPAMAMRR